MKLFHVLGVLFFALALFFQILVPRNAEPNIFDKFSKVADKENQQLGAVNKNSDSFLSSPAFESAISNLRATRDRVRAPVENALHGKIALPLLALITLGIGLFYFVFAVLRHEPSQGVKGKVLACLLLVLFVLFRFVFSF